MDNMKGSTAIMANPLQLNPNESILYRSQPSRQWFMLAGRIGLEILEVAIFIFLSFILLTGVGNFILARFLPSGLADGLSRVIFEGIVPILIIAWFAEDTARIFTSELVLTSQRIWTRGSPYAWTSVRETPLTDIQSMVTRREAVFVRLKSNRKVQVLLFPHGKQIVEAYQQFIQKTGAG
jgi:hypothetical protein